MSDTPQEVKYRLVRTLPDGQRQTHEAYGINAAMRFIVDEHETGGADWDFASDQRVAFVTTDNQGRPYAREVAGSDALAEMTRYTRERLPILDTTPQAHVALTAAEGDDWVQEQYENMEGTAFAAGLAGGPIVGAAVRTAGRAISGNDYSEEFERMTEANPWAYGAGNVVGTIAQAGGPGLIARGLASLGIAASKSILARGAIQGTGGLVGLTARAGNAVRATEYALRARGVSQGSARMISRIAAGATEGAMGAAIYDVADAVSSNRHLVVDQVAADVGLWALVGGTLEGALGGLGAAVRGLRRTSAGRLVNKGRTELLGDVPTNFTEKVDAMASGQMGPGSGYRTLDALANRAGKRSGRGGVARWINDPDIAAAGRRTSEDILDAHASTAGASLHKALNQVDEDLWATVGPISSVDQLGDFPNPAYTALKTHEQLAAPTPLHSLLASVPELATDRAALKEARKLLSPITENFEDMARLSNRALRSDNNEALKLLYVRGARTAQELYNAKKQSTSPFIQDALDRTRTQLQDMLSNPDVWGDIAIAYKQRNDAIKTFIGLREGLAGTTWKNTNPTSFINRMRSLVREASEPVGDSIAKQSMQAVDDISNIVRNNPTMFPRMDEALASLKEARQQLQLGRDNMMAHSMYKRLKQSDAGHSRGTVGDVAVGAAGWALGGPAWGMAAASAKRIGHMYRNPVQTLEDMRNLGHVVRGASKRGVAQTAKVASVLRSSPRSKATLLLSAKALAGGEGSVEHFDGIADHLERLTDYHEDLLDEMELSSTGLDSIDPSLGSALRERMVTGVSYLRGHLPARLRNPLTGKPQPVSRAEMRSFMRRFNALNDPHAVLDHFVEGRLSYEEVDAVKTVFPELYAEQSLNVLTAMTEHKGAIPYQTRLQLSILFGVPDASLTGDMLMMLQSNYYQTPAQAGAVLSPSRRSTPNLSQSEASFSQSLRS